jgi:hypothetical protein
MSTKPELNLDGLDCTQDVVLKPERRPDGSTGVWITVGDASVQIITRDGRLAVSIYVLGHEMDDPLGEVVLNLAEVTAQKAEWDDEVTNSEPNSEDTP